MLGLMVNRIERERLGVQVRREALAWMKAQQELVEHPELLSRSTRLEIER